MMELLAAIFPAKAIGRKEGSSLRTVLDGETKFKVLPRLHRFVHTVQDRDEHRRTMPRAWEAWG